MFASPRVECASVEHTIGTPAAIALSDVGAGKIEPVGQAVHLERDAGLGRDGEDLVQVERISGRWLSSRPFGWLRHRAAGCCIVRHAPRQLLAWSSLARM